MELTSKDYGTILKHYKMKVPKTRKKRRQVVEKKLASKMCKCIKSVQKNNQKLDEPGAIAICSNSIFTRRCLKYNRIACKKGYKFIGNKKTKRKLEKIKKLCLSKTVKRKNKTRKNN